MAKDVYYLTGMGGRLIEGLGSALLARGYLLDGRELSGDFRKLDFESQINVVASDLEARHWFSDGLIIANSFGAYLFLHAQQQLPKYPGQVVLLSPIVGEFENSNTMMNFVPPRANRLFDLVSQGNFVTADRLDVYVGSDDWQSNPTNVQRLFQNTSVEVAVVANAGHSLPKEFVGQVLDRLIA